MTAVQLERFPANDLIQQCSQMMVLSVYVDYLSFLGRGLKVCAVISGKDFESTSRPNLKFALVKRVLGFLVETYCRSTEFAVANVSNFCDLRAKNC